MLPNASMMNADALDTKAQAGELAAKTAFNVWSVWTTAAKAACGQWKKDKSRRSKVRDDNPCVGVAAPDRADDKDLQWLYPVEFLVLIACVLVPIEARRMYALAVYLFVRGGELKALTWPDVDLERGILSVRRSFDRATGLVKQTKTGNKGHPAVRDRTRAVAAAPDDARRGGRGGRQPIRGEVPFDGTNGRRQYDYILVPVIGADGEVEAVAGRGAKRDARCHDRLGGKTRTSGGRRRRASITTSSSRSIPEGHAPRFPFHDIGSHFRFAHFSYRMALICCSGRFDGVPIGASSTPRGRLQSPQA